MSDVEVLMDVKPNTEAHSKFIIRDPVSVEVDAVVTMSEHWVRLCVSFFCIEQQL